MTAPQSEPTEFSKIDELEAKLKAQSSELYKRKMQIFDQHVIIRERDSSSRSQSKTIQDLKRKLQDLPKVTVLTNLHTFLVQP